MASWKASSLSAALSSLYGPRISRGPSRTSATATITARKRQALLLYRLLQRRRRVPDRAARARCRNTKLNGRTLKVHRLIAGALLGRPLLPSEVVHHVDGNGHNNHPLNLQIISRGSHCAMHAQKHPLVSFCKRCGAPFLTTPYEARHGHGKIYCSCRCAAIANNRRRRAQRALGLRPVTG